MSNQSWVGHSIESVVVAGCSMVQQQKGAIFFWHFPGSARDNTSIGDRFLNSDCFGTKEHCFLTELLGNRLTRFFWNTNSNRLLCLRDLLRSRLRTNWWLHVFSAIKKVVSLMIASASSLALPETQRKQRELRLHTKQLYDWIQTMDACFLKGCSSYWAAFQPLPWQPLHFLKRKGTATVACADVKIFLTENRGLFVCLFVVVFRKENNVMSHWAALRLWPRSPLKCKLNSMQSFTHNQKTKVELEKNPEISREILSNKEKRFLLSNTAASFWAFSETLTAALALTHCAQGNSKD